MGIYAIREEGSGPEEEPSDVEGLQNLPSVTLGCCLFLLPFELISNIKM